ncbi:hypothetical protein BRIN106911_10465 [Brevibacillus invocatus]
MDERYPIGKFQHEEEAGQSWLTTPCQSKYPSSCSKPCMPAGWFYCGASVIQSCSGHLSILTQGSLPYGKASGYTPGMDATM